MLESATHSCAQCERFYPHPIRPVQESDLSRWDSRIEPLNKRVAQVFSQATTSDRPSLAIDQAVNFFKLYLLTNVDENTLFVLKYNCCDYRQFLHFSSIKTAWMLGFEPLKDRPIPTFFDGITKEIIQGLRAFSIPDHVLAEITAFMRSGYACDCGKHSAEANEVLTMLRVASRAMKNDGLFEAAFFAFRAKNQQEWQGLFHRFSEEMSSSVYDSSLPRLDCRVVALLEQNNTTAINLAIARVFFLYTFGMRRKDPLPHFLTAPVVIDRISELRRLYSEPLSCSLSAHLHSIPAFEERPFEVDVQPIMMKLKQPIPSDSYTMRAMLHSIGAFLPMGIKI